VASVANSPSRPSRPSKPLVPTLPSAAALFQPIPTDFAGFTAQHLGDLGTGTDGFDAIFAIPASALAGDEHDASTFDTYIAGASFDSGAFAKVYVAPVDVLLPNFYKDGDARNHATQNPGQIGGTPVLKPPPKPPAAAGGSAGHGSGGGAPPPSSDPSHNPQPRPGGDPGCDPFSSDCGAGDPTGPTGGIGSCFSGNTRVMTLAGAVRLDRFINGDLVFGHFGLRPAHIVKHEHDGPMLDMGAGELVTKDHRMRTGQGFAPADFSPAEQVFAGEVHFTGEVFDLVVETEIDEERHYILANGHTAHNKEIISWPWPT
jgi:hypothetical protein